MNSDSRLYVAFLCSFLVGSTASAENPTLLSAQKASEFANKFANLGTDVAEFSRVRIHENLCFTARDQPQLLLDLYLPVKSESSVPCVVMIAGGGFRARGKEAFASYSAYLATQGFAAACISYRGTPDDQYLATIHDCKSAVRFIRANAATFGIDAEHIGAMGQSAGGHLAALLGTTGGVEAMEGQSKTANTSSRIQAAACFAGVYDFVSRLREGGHQQHDLAKKRRTNGEWVGKKFSTESTKWKDASPINHLSSDDPPLLLIHSKTDKVVPHEQALQMHAAMQSQGLTCQLLILPTGGHGIAGAKSVNEKVWSEAISFLNEHLR